MHASEEDMIRRAVRGDEDALAALLESHGRRIAASLDIAPKWRTIVSADDVMQVTYLEAFLRIGDFQTAGGPSAAPAFAAWLRRIADNNLRDAVKELSRAKRPQPDMRAHADGDRSYVDLVEILAGPGGTPSGAVAVKEAVTAVEAALATLPPDYEQVLRLYELRGLAIKDVAGAMNRSEGSIKMLLTRARDRLRESLGSASRFFSQGS